MLTGGEAGDDGRAGADVSDLGNSLDGGMREGGAAKEGRRYVCRLIIAFAILNGSASYIAGLGESNDGPTVFNLFAPPASSEGGDCDEGSVGGGEGNFDKARTPLLREEE